jgi:RND family efflux transporter MFP subunit
MSDRIRTFAPVVLLFVVGCMHGPPPPLVPPPPKVTVRQPIEREVIEYAEATGRTEAKETYEVRVRVKGYLKSIRFVEGDMVKKDDLLYEIDPRTFEADLESAEAEIARAEAQLKQARSEWERADRMRLTRAISEEELTQKFAAQDAAVAALRKARATAKNARLELEFTRIVSPIDGMIGRTLVTQGNLVGYNEPTMLTTVVRIDPIYVYFDLPETDMLAHDQLVRQQAATALTAKTPAYVGLAIDTGHPHQGIIDFRDNKVDPGTGTIRLRAVIENKSAVLAPGLYCRVKVPISQPKKSWMVPESAIGQDQAGRYVLVVGADDTVDVRRVRTGVPTEDGMIAVEAREGKLGGSDWVVVNGLQRARPGSKVTPVKAGNP